MSTKSQRSVIYKLDELPTANLLFITSKKCKTYMFEIYEYRGHISEWMLEQV